MTLKQDRNFDSLIDRFATKIYDTSKGDWRLKLIKEDLQFLHDQPQPLTIWDAGCGFGQISLWLAEHDHQLTLCDVSAKMLARAQQQFNEAGVTGQFHHCAAQDLAPELPDFDVVLFHAVLEWLVAPLKTLETVVQQVKLGGYLSLLFYNRNAMIYTNTLKGGWRLQHLLDGSYLGKGKRLTPPNPQYPQVVYETLTRLGFNIRTHTGIRVFSDYMPKTALAETDTEELHELEYRHCRLPTFRDMGRYVHVLARRDSGPATKTRHSPTL